MDGGPGRHGLAADDAGFDEGPGSVADGGDGLAGLGELLDEVDRCLFYAELVGVDLAARKDEGVVFGWFRVADGTIHLDGFAPVGLIPTLYFSRFYGDNINLCSSFLEICLGLGEFDLLEAVGGENGDTFSI